MPSLSPVTAAVSAPLPVCPEPGCDHLLELANGAILIRAAETGHIQFWNSAAARLYGWSADDAVGQVAHTLLQTRLPVPASEIEARLAVEDRWAGEVRQVRRDGTEMVVHTRWSVRRDPGGAPLAILELNDDVTESRRSAEELRLLHAVLLDIGESDNLTAAYRAMLECIGEVTNWAVGLAWVPDDTGQQLQLGALWPESTGSCAARLTRFRQTTFRPAEGLVGQVWATGRPIWLRDVSAESAYARARAAAEVGLKAGLLVPVLADDEVVAVLEFLTPAARDEDERLVRTVTAVAAQLGAAIRRKRARAEVAYLRRQTDVAERRLATLVEAAPDAIVIFDAEGRIQLVNRSAETMFGYGCEELAAQAVESLMPGLRQAAPAAIHRGAETARLADAGGRELRPGAETAANSRSRCA